jgi:hypothetical protein
VERARQLSDQQRQTDRTLLLVHSQQLVAAEAAEATEARMDVLAVLEAVELMTAEQLVRVMLEVILPSKVKTAERVLELSPGLAAEDILIMEAIHRIRVRAERVETVQLTQLAVLL